MRQSGLNWPEDHADCRDAIKLFLECTIRNSIGDLVGEVLVTDFPCTAGGFPETTERCPHGTMWWTTPNAALQRMLYDFFANGGTVFL